MHAATRIALTAQLTAQGHTPSQDEDVGRIVKIADPANVNGQDHYSMTTIDMANWIASRGYSA